MKKIFFTIILAISWQFIICQGINSRAIEITNTETDKYVLVTGTKIKIIPPENFKENDKKDGFHHEISGSSIIITEVQGDVNRNFYLFDKKRLFQTGVIVQKETFYKINGYEALMIEGKQTAYDNVYEKKILLIGDYKYSYMISASMPQPTSERQIINVMASMLSVIYNPETESKITDRFDYSVNVEGTFLKEAKSMIASLTYTDDGNVPSKTENKVSMTIKKSDLPRVLSEEEKMSLCTRIFNLYPLTWNEGSDSIPHKYSTKEYKGYEIYGIGQNTNNPKQELIYHLVLFDNKNYYVLTGMSFGDFENCIQTFRKVAETIEKK